MFRLDRGNTGRVDAAHLARADTDGLTALGVDDGIGLHVLGYFPGEDQVVDLLLGRCALGHDFQVFATDHFDITALNQQAAVDAFEVPGRGAVFAPLAAGQQAHVGFGRDDGAGFLAHGRGDDHFNELTLNNGLGRFGVQFAVEGDDAAESRFGIRGVSQFVGLADAAFSVRAYGNTARVGVLDDHASWFDEAFYAFQRGVGVGHVVE